MRDRVAHVFGGEDASTLAFASKLARKYGWGVKFALRAILEYKKFVFLGVTGQQRVTPSKVIDMVWHQHIEFTRGYRGFCESVLGANFDHDPELVPFDRQTAVYDAQYHTTLERYHSEFKMDPPEDIWGTPKFDQRRVKRAEATLVERRSSDQQSGGGGDDLLLWQYFSTPTPTHNHETGGRDSFHDSISKPVGYNHADSLSHAGHTPGGDGGGSSGGTSGGCSGGSSCSGGGGCSSG